MLRVTDLFAESIDIVIIWLDTDALTRLFNVGICVADIFAGLRFLLNLFLTEVESNRTFTLQIVYSESR